MVEQLEIHRKSRSKKVEERKEAAKQLGEYFAILKDKKQAWDDLHRLTFHNDSVMRGRAADALGSAFQHVPNKKQAWDDLIILTSDDDREVRTAANYSSGRASIFRAGKAENDDDFRKELEKALAFFENASKEATIYNPASFCLPFYRSFYTITFRKEEAEAEVKKSIDEAKRAVKGSKSKEKLLEAVENLSNALREAEKARTLDEKQCDLNKIMQYLDHTAELLDSTEKTAPGATGVIRKGAKMINDRITKLIPEIKKKAKIACEQSRGTPTEKIACAANLEIQKWQLGDQEQTTRNVENLIFTLTALVPSTPEYKEIRNKIKEIRAEKDLTKQLDIITILIPLIPKAPKKSLPEWLNSPATIAAFAGFIVTEVGTYYFQTSYNHLISVFIALFVFIIVALFNKR